MTIAEQHTAIKALLNNLDTFAHQRIESDVLDLFINRAIRRFVKTHYTGNTRNGKGFEESQKRIDDVRQLISRATKPAITYGSTGIYGSTIDIFKASLPTDYIRMISQSIKVYGDQCQGDVTYTESTAVLQAGEPACATIDIYDPDNYPSGYVNLLLKLTDLSSNTYILHNQTYTPSSYQDLITQILNSTIVNLLGVTITMTQTSSTQIEFCVDNTIGDNTDYNGWILTAKFTANADGKDTNLNSTNYTLSGATDDTTGTQYTEGSGGSYYVEPLYVVQHDDLELTLRHSFSKPFIDQPIYVQEEDNMYLYTDGTFAPYEVYLTYLRYPVEVNLSTGVDCELPEDTHDEVNSLTVQEIIEATNSGRFQTNTINLQTQE